MLRRVLGPLGLAAASLGLVFALLELGTRIFVPAPIWRFHDAAAEWERDDELGWVTRPEMDDTRVIGGERQVRFRTNADSLVPHTATRERPGAAPRILFVGDSMVLGRSVHPHETYPERLAALLAERGVEVEVLNAGVMGYSTDQALLSMRRLLPLYRPDLVVYASTLNDFGGNELREANGQSKPMFELSGGGELVLVPPAPSREIRRRDWRFRTWLQYSAFYRWIQPRIRQLRAEHAGWQHRNLLGQMQEVYVDPASLERLNWRLYGALLAEMQRLARAHDAGFFAVANAEVGEVWEPYILSACDRLGATRERYDPGVVQRRAAERAAEVGVAFVQSLERFAAQPARGPFHLLPWDPHLSPAGHELMAELLADYLVEAGWLRGRDPVAARPASAP